MSRQYYGTAEELYYLFINHPVMSQMLDEFFIDTNYNPEEPDDPIRLRDVCDYLVAHEDEIINQSINMYYNDSDILQEIAELYGFDSINYPLPYSQYKSPRNTSLEEFLNYTLYFYKFAVSDNFYEKQIFNFIPEFDREEIKKDSKLKLTVEAIGKKLDDLEDKISRLNNIYDADEIPEELLDYLGQNLGYEKEDYSLSGFSFRELLKNIIEIYKVKGTNHSFSFFFKFLGFEVDLKEFYFNRDAQNVEGFPGIEDIHVEYYLTTKNPLTDTSFNKPCNFLQQTRDLNEWEIEYNSLENNGCINSIQYMLGNETYNLNGTTWHQNPWKYFKTNLIEYELSPFFNKLNLTASDNETIKKYVKFLSPTYLFTWININVAPWIENVNIITDINSQWLIKINKILGDPHPTPENWPAHPQEMPGIPENITGVFNKKIDSDEGFEPPYLDYENISDYIALYDIDTNDIRVQITNRMDLGGRDIIGSFLRRDGIHIRQQGHPKHIPDARHAPDKRIAYDDISLLLKDSALPDEEENWLNYSMQSYPKIPTEYLPQEGRSIKSSNIVQLSWNNTEGAVGYRVQLDNNKNMNSIIIDDDSLLSPEYTTSSLHNDKYFWRIKVKNNANYPDSDPNRWTHWSPIWSFIVKTLPFPYNNEIIENNSYYISSNYNWNLDFTQQLFLNAELNIEINIIPNTKYYHFQVTTDNSFSIINFENSQLSRPEFNITLPNNIYYWRYRSLNRSTNIWSSWSSSNKFTINFPTII